jgi:hypothetical protein
LPVGFCGVNFGRLDGELIAGHGGLVERHYRRQRWNLQRPSFVLNKRQPLPGSKCHVRSAIAAARIAAARRPASALS